MVELSDGRGSCAAPLKFTARQTSHVEPAINNKESHESRVLGDLGIGLRGPTSRLLSGRSSSQCRTQQACELILLIIFSNEFIGISLFGVANAQLALREDLLALHSDLLACGRVFAVAFAVGLDVFAISLAAQLNCNASVRVGMAFASAEIVMQVVGYGLGAGANHYFRRSCRVRWFWRSLPVSE